MLLDSGSDLFGDAPGDDGVDEAVRGSAARLAVGVGRLEAGAQEVVGEFGQPDVGSHVPARQEASRLGSGVEDDDLLGVQRRVGARDPPGGGGAGGRSDVGDGGSARIARRYPASDSTDYPAVNPDPGQVFAREGTNPMVEVASLDEVPLRDVWRDEARDFTPWLATHLDQLGKELQMDLELERAEFAVGPFSADVVLWNANTGQRVVVENLLETTDHDHLGKLITYAAALEARWAVLVAKAFRPEHRSALTWLNSISGEGCGFFGIEVHAVRIGDSPAAVRLDVVVAPDDFARRARAGAKTVSETNSRYTDWWAEFLPAFHEAHPGWSNAQVPQPVNWMTFPSGKSGVSYELSFAYPTGASNYSLRAGIYIDDGEAVYPALEAQRSAIEAACGLALQWEPLENARASRVATYLDPADPADRARWPAYRAWAIETLGELRRAFSAPIKDLK